MDKELLNLPDLLGE